MSRWLCVAALNVWLGTLTACSLLFDPVGSADPPPCPVGLSLLYEDLTQGLDTDLWWTQADGDTDITPQPDGLHLTTGMQPIDRGAAFGTHSFHEAQGILAFEILDLDVDGASSFSLQLDPESDDSPVAIAISGGVLAMAGTGTVAEPNYPIWLAITLQQGEAQLSISATASDFEPVMRQSFSAQEVKVVAGLTATASSAKEHTMTIGSIGLPPAPGCIE